MLVNARQNLQVFCHVCPISKVIEWTVGRIFWDSFLVCFYLFAKLEETWAYIHSEGKEGKVEDRSNIRECWNETVKGSWGEVTQSTGKGFSLTRGATFIPLNSREIGKWYVCEKSYSQTVWRCYPSDHRLSSASWLSVAVQGAQNTLVNKKIWLLHSSGSGFSGGETVVIIITIVIGYYYYNNHY